MKRFWSTLLGVLFVMALLFFIAGAFMDNHWRVEVSTIIDAPRDAIHPFVNVPRQYPRWMGWNDAIDPSLRRSFDGPEAGVGATIAWEGRTMGRGRMRITESSETAGVAWDEWIEASTANAHGSLSYDAIDDQHTRVTWTDVGELPRPHGVYFKPMVQSALTQHFETALRYLKAAAEGRPPPAPPVHAEGS